MLPLWDFFVILSFQLCSLPVDLSGAWCLVHCMMLQMELQWSHRHAAAVPAGSCLPPSRRAFGVLLVVPEKNTLCRTKALHPMIFFLNSDEHVQSADP